MSEERRIVTVLFADVTGSTAMGEEMDPEEVRGLLGRYYEIAKGVVSEHGGTLEKFIGDAVMAVFGLPSAHGDDAERAVAAALALRDRARADERLGPRLAVRFGVGTGEVVAARDPSAGDFLVTGDAVNVAARLQQAAEPWQVLVTERTAHAAAGGFDFGGDLQVEAKGKSAPIVARAVLNRRERSARLPARPPLVGRNADVEQLQLVAKRAFSERRPSLVSLIAPAGTGKTRLLEEFLEWLEGFRPETIVATAQCLPYGQQLTYWPMRQVLFTLTGVTEDASPSELLDAIRAWLTRAGADPAGAELLAATIGMAEMAPDRSQLFSAWRDAIEAASRVAPVVVVFEDLHWSSDSLLDLVEYLMQPRGEAPILLIALTRPELLDRRPTWGGGRRNHLALSLEPLSDGAVAELVRHLLETESPELVATVVERSEGNPFYAGELVRSAIERGSIEKLPDTVQATVLARLDLLPPGERRALQLGSVFGRSFRIPGIAAVEADLDDPEALVERLAMRDLIWPADADRYTFRHILIREVAYGTLPRVERARLHAAAAGWLAARAEGREQAVAEIIALHYREAAVIASAIDPDSEETGRIRDLAVAWLERALDAATAVEASPEAVRHARSALELARPEKMPRLHERIGDLLGGDAGSDSYIKALELYEAAGAPAADRLRVLAGRLMAVTRMQGAIANRMGDEEMDALRAKGEALAAQTNDRAALARFRAADAFYPFWKQADATSAELAAADRSAETAYELAAEIDDANLMSAALDAQGGIGTAKEDWVAVRELAYRRLEFGDRLSLYERVDAYSMIAWSACLTGELQEAVRVSGAAVALVRPGQAPGPVLHALSWRSCALCLVGEWDEVLRVGARSVAVWLETGQLAAGYALRGFLSALDVARARRDQNALDSLGEVTDAIIRRYPAGHRYGAMEGYGRNGGNLQLRLEDITTRSPTEVFERCLGYSSDHGRFHPPDIVDTLLARAVRGYPLLEAQCRRANGLRDGDVEQLRLAEAIWVRVGAAPYAGRARHEIGRLSGDREALEAGRRELERLGDVDYLDRFDPSRS